VEEVDRGELFDALLDEGANHSFDLGSYLCGYHSCTASIRQKGTGRAKRGKRKRTQSGGFEFRHELLQTWRIL
jgi:hypothetical protein